MADAVEALPTPELGESGRSSPSHAASPEFEFWMVGNTPPSSFPSPALLTADELFSGGVVLPLHTLRASPTDDGEEVQDAETAEEDAATAQQQPLAEAGILPTPDLPAVTFKWKDIFRAGGGESNKERKKAERRVSSNAELININIWPFSRSRSAGAGASGSLSISSKASKTNPAATNANGSGNNGVVVASNAGTVTLPAASSAPAPVSGRKVSSAPCSRSNSRGESGPEPPTIPAAAAAAGAVEAAAVPGPTSMFRRLVPGRNTGGAGASSAATGIRVGRPSPVWQLRRNKLQQTAAEQKQASSAARKKAAVSAPNAAAASDDKASTAVATPSVTAAAAAGCRNNAEGGVEEGPNPPQGLFGLRTFFSKKVY